MYSRDRFCRLACLLLVVLVGAGCGSTASSDTSEPAAAPGGQVDQDLPDAAAEPAETAPEPAAESAEPAEPAEPAEASAAAAAASSKLTLDPITAAPGEALCTVVGVNFLDRAQVSFEFVGNEPLSALSVDYRVTIAGVTTDDSTWFGYVKQGEPIRILAESSVRVEPDVSLDDASCEVLGVTQTPLADALPITATCETGQLDANGRLDVVITADTSTATRLAEGIPVVNFNLGLYDSNGVRLDRALIRSVVLPDDGAMVRLHQRAWLPNDSHLDLADYELSCDAFAFSISDPLAAAPDATCTIEGVDGFSDWFGSVDGELEDNFDMWLAVVDPSGTWVGTTRAYVGPDFMDFETLAPVPTGVEVSDLACRVVGVEQ